jgi:hypothetical protein
MSQPFQPVDERGDRRRVQPELFAEPAGGRGGTGACRVQQVDQRAEVGWVQPVQAGEFRAKQVELHGDGAQQVHHLQAGFPVIHRTIVMHRTIVIHRAHRTIVMHGTIFPGVPTFV